MHPVLPLALVLLAGASAAGAEEPCAADVEGALRRLLSAEEPPTLQVRALRRDLVRKLLSALDALDRGEVDDEAARWNGLPGPAKRNLEALARAGYLRTRADLDEAEDEEEEEVKRSIANLAKTGQLPVRQDGKRGIQSLARNGELHGKRQPKRESQPPPPYDRETDATGEPYGKRSIASLARNYELPYRGQDKRFLGSLARTGDLARFYGGGDKRNVASLAREGGWVRGKRAPLALVMDAHTHPVVEEKVERSIQSLARNGELHGKRQPKRESQPPPPYDRESDGAGEPYGKRSIASLARNYELPYRGQDKRFLGSLARTGDLARFYGGGDKRNVASLAREGGWMRGKRAPLALVMDAHTYPVVDNRIVEDTDAPTEDKRNIASIKAQYKPKFKRSTPVEAARAKRETGNDWPEDASDEYLSPMFQNGHIPTMYEYEELLRELEQAQRDAADRAPDVDKRFLGRLPMMGKPKTTASPKPHQE